MPPSEIEGWVGSRGAHEELGEDVGNGDVEVFWSRV